jgi:hypothetical protein
MLLLRNKVFAHIDGSEFETTPLFETWLLVRKERRMRRSSDGQPSVLLPNRPWFSNT